MLVYQRVPKFETYPNDPKSITRQHMWSGIFEPIAIAIARLAMAHHDLFRPFAKTDRPFLLVESTAIEPQGPIPAMRSRCNES